MRSADESLLRKLDKAIQNANRRGKDFSQEEVDRLICEALLSSREERSIRKDHQDHALERLKATTLDTLRRSTGLPPNQVLAASILRMTTEERLDWLGENPWRATIVALVESCFGTALYKRDNIATAQNHKKLQRMAQLVREHENDFQTTLDALPRLDSVKKQRQKLMSVLNSDFGKCLFHPFLPADIEPKLSDLYSRTTTYLSKSDDVDVVDAWSSAAEAAKIVRDSCAGSEIHYRETLGRFAARVHHLLQEHFRKNSAAQPTVLEVVPPIKKYPLFARGRSFRVDFFVKNLGLGHANDVKLLVAGDEGVEVAPGCEEIDLGRLAPLSNQRVTSTVRIQNSVPQAHLEVLAEWQNFDGSAKTNTVRLPLHSQKEGLDWAALGAAEPYSLEPVETESELIGRRELLGRLVATVNAKNAGSAIVEGQKRVGKSSLARALASNVSSGGHVAIYLEAGDYIDPKAQTTLENLGRKLVYRIRRSRKEFVEVPAPTFRESLAPLSDFLDECLTTVSGVRIVIILDEFDQLPYELYQPGSLGDAFFVTLRSLTSRPMVSFILVGAERMAHIKECQGQQLNKWKSVRVDYFDRSRDWSDYKELVERPVKDSIEYTDDAISCLYEESAGNPYFTNLLCGYVFREAVQRRDGHVTSDEVHRAINVAIDEADFITFQHFWDDGIRESGTALSERSVRRRRILVAVVDSMGGAAAAAVDVVRQQALRNVAGVETELSHFVVRKVLERKEHKYTFKVPLFGRWLRKRGVLDVMSTYMEADYVDELREREAANKISEEAMTKLVDGWGPYKGQSITEDRIRDWLNQFSGSEEQNAMFEMLQGLRFITHSEVRQKLREIGSMVEGYGTSGGRSRSGRKRSDTLVSYLDSAGNSGADFARLYADEMSIYTKNVVEKGRLAEQLMARDDVRRVVFIDDIVGTGDNMVRQFRNVHPALKALFVDKDISVVYAVVLADQRGWSMVENELAGTDLRVEIRYCELLGDTERAFGPGGGRSWSERQRSVAREVALKYGKRVWERHPLGYGDSELSVVFEKSCPNNTLPILWKDSVKPSWRALFRR